MTQPYTGQCLCGAIAYEVQAISPKMAHCHCSMCRKFHGAAFSTFGEVHQADLRWTRGQELLQSFTAHNGTIRQFCKTCGSSMTFFSPKNPDSTIELALGTLDTDIDIQPDAHIFVGSKSNWTVLSDGLPQFIEGRNSEPVK